MSPSPNKILVIKPSSLGDIVHALPAVSALRRKWPRARLTWMVKQCWAPILEGNPDIDEVWPVDFSFRNWPALVAKLRRDTYDLIVDFQGLFRSGILAWLSGASWRVGFAQAREGAPLFYSDPIAIPFLNTTTWRLGEMHAVDRNLAIVEKLGADSMQPQWHFPDKEEDRSVVAHLLAQGGVRRGDRLVAIAPWSRSPLKCWPLPCFVELCDLLMSQHHVRPIVLGSEADQGAGESFQYLESCGLVNMVGKVSLRQLPVLLRGALAFVGNDSALLHIAAGLGIPAVGLYGPTHPKATGPYPLEHHRALRVSLWCSPCGKNICRNETQGLCLESLTVGDVFQHASQLLDMHGLIR